MADIELISRLMAAYQFIALNRGDAVALADVRLFLVGPHTVEAHELNPLLRALNGTVVDFWAESGAEYETGLLRLLEAPQSASWDQLDGGVEIGDVIYTHMSVTPS